MRHNSANAKIQSFTGQNDVLHTWGIAVLGVLEKLLPEAATAVEHKSLRLQQDFAVLTDALRKLPPDISLQAVMQRIVTDMQFQDRNSQIMADVVFIVKQYRDLLAAKAPCDDAAAKLLEGVHLSEIRNRLAEALSMPSDKPQAKKTNNDVELF